MEINSTKIFWRFGLLGNFLYKKYSTNKSWQDQWFIFKIFSIYFTLIIGGLFGLLMFFINKSSLIWFMPLSLLLGLINGFWAKKFFST